MTENIFTAFYQTVFSTIDEGALLLDPEKRILSLNPAAEKITAWTSQEATGQSLQSFFGTLPDPLPDEPFTARLIRQDGTETLIMLSLIPVGKEPTPRGWVGILHPLHDDDSRASEHLLKDFFEHTAIGVYRTTPDGRILMANPALCHLLGYDSFEELSRRDLTKEGFEPEYSRASFIERLEKEGRIVGLEAAWKRRDGTTVYIRENARVVRDPSGRPLYYEGTVEDITEKKRIELSLKESEAKNRLLIQQSPLGIFLMDREGNLQIVNQSLVRMLGSPAMEATLQINMLTFPLLKEYGISTLLQRCLREGKSLRGETSYKTKWGKWLIGEYYFDPVRDAEGNIIGVQGMVVDVTQKKEIESKIREEEEKFISIFEHTSDGILYTDDQGIIQEANPALERMIEIPRERLIGENGLLLARRLIAPNTMAMVLKHFRRLLTGKPIRNFEVPLKDRILEVSAARSYGGHRMTIIARDITERKRVEEKLQKELAEKEILIKEIHHRVKNNLQVISSLLNLHVYQIRDPQVLEIFKECQNRIRSLALVHEHLYGSPSLAEVDTPRYFGMLIATLYQTYCSDPKRVMYKAEIDRIALGVDQAIPCGLLLNELFTNALKYAFPPEWKGKGKILVRFEKTDSGACRLSVEDNGIGLPETVDPKTTQTLGLHLVDMLTTKQLKGTYEIHRRPGTIFTITFPPSPTRK